jgi:hypothetical protein
MTEKEPEQFNPKEAQERFEAALKGARLAGHKPMESLTRKKTKAQPNKRAKRKKV